MLVRHADEKRCLCLECRDAAAHGREDGRHTGLEVGRAANQLHVADLVPAIDLRAAIIRVRAEGRARVSERGREQVGESRWARAGGRVEWP